MPGSGTTTGKHAAAPLVIPLGLGLGVGGVNTWAVRLASGLAARGRGAMLLLHPEPAGSARLEVDLHPGVRVARVPGSFGERPGDLSGFIPHYLSALREMAERWGGPVAVAPTMHGDCFGVAAAISMTDPGLLRVIGWQHSDIEYDARVLARYEAVISTFVAVSDRIEGTLRGRMPARTGDIRNVPYGVEVGELPVRPGRRGGGLRLIYTGRLEHHQKRVLTLIRMMEELDRQGTGHGLTVVGDGPASQEFEAAAAASPARDRIKRLGAVAPAEVRRMLAEADAFVLPSRYEGLSVSMLEAMAAGCVPVVARTESGALQAIEAGYNGEIASVSPDEDERAAGPAMAAAVEKLAGRDLGAMSAAAWRTARERYSVEAHVDRVAALLDAAAAGPDRPWPADRACAFSGGSEGGSGSVPADGAARLAALLKSLAGRRVAIHGTGQHTIQLGAVLAASPAHIVGFCDDDRARCGQRLWGWPIVAPSAVSELGATDVVIGSWMHQDAVWARRGVYEERGVRAHRIYV